MSDIVQQPISSDDLIPLNAFEGRFPIKIHMAYADEGYEDNHFKGLYSENAKIMWAHKDLAPVILLGSLIANRLYGWTFDLKDCLRPVEAQEKMAAYGYDPSLVSTPGSGAHPRAMAIDICPINANGHYVDMGTPFDYFVDDPRKDNPAARAYTKFAGSAEQVANICTSRSWLETSMRIAATSLQTRILPLPQEWWDFRFNKDIFDQYLPLREADLAPYQRVIDPDIEGVTRILKGDYPETMRRAIEEIEQQARLAFEASTPKSVFKTAAHPTAG